MTRFHLIEVLPAQTKYIIEGLEPGVSLGWRRVTPLKNNDLLSHCELLRECCGLEKSREEFLTWLDLGRLGEVIAGRIKW